MFRPGSDYYGAIKTTQEQKYGKKEADKAGELLKQADNPNIIVSKSPLKQTLGYTTKWCAKFQNAYSKILSKVLMKKSVATSLMEILAKMGKMKSRRRLGTERSLGKNKDNVEMEEEEEEEEETEEEDTAEEASSEEVGGDDGEEDDVGDEDFLPLEESDPLNRDAMLSRLKGIGYRE